MVGWHCRLNGYKLSKLGDNEGQGKAWSRKELDITE